MILFFGPAGAGKSMQGQMLASRHNWPWISTGKLFRESHDEAILKTIAAGSLINDEQTNSILKTALSWHGDAQQVVLDGYPRRLEQAKWLIDNASNYKHPVEIAIVIDLPKEEILKRIQARGRHDDTPGSVEKRLNIYHTQIDPILSYFNKQKIPIVPIKGAGSIDAVQARIEAEVRARLKMDAAS